MKRWNRSIVPLVFAMAFGLPCKFARAAAAQDSVASPDLRLPLPVMKTLPNGARVAWLESSAVPVVDFVFLSEWGSRRDPAGKSGLSNLGTAAWRSTSRPTASDALGASRGIAFDGDQVTLNVEGFSSDRTELLREFLQGALHPDFEESDIRVQRERIMAAWSAASESPDDLAQAFFERIALRETPYWRGGMGGPSELRSIARSDLLEWHRHVVEPSRVILFGTGPGRPDAFFAEVEKLAGTLGWTAAPSERGVPAAEVRPKPGRAPSWLLRVSRGSFPAVGGAGKQKRNESPIVLLVDRPGAPQAHIRVGTRAPAFRDADRVPLGLANGALGETFNSRLNREIRDGVALVYGLMSGFAWMRDASLFGVSLVAPPQAAGDALKKTLDVLARTGTGDFTAEELAEARTAGLGGYPLQFPGALEIGMRWLATVVDGRDPRELSEFPARVQAASVESVNDAVRRHWGVFAGTGTGAAWIVVAGDAKEVGESLRKAGFPDSSIVRTRFASLEELSR